MKFRFHRSAVLALSIILTGNTILGSIAVPHAYAAENTAGETAEIQGNNTSVPAAHDSASESTHSGQSADNAAVSFGEGSASGAGTTGSGHADAMSASDTAGYAGGGQ